MNLFGCEIPDERLAVIRNIEGLDTFIHESTLIPGLYGDYKSSKLEGNKKSLKVCVAYVYKNDQYSDERLSEMMEDYTISRNYSIMGDLQFKMFGIR